MNCRMVRRTAAAYLFSVLCIAPVLASAQTSKPAKPPARAVYRIAGTVVNAATSEPLPRAQVSLTNTKDGKDFQSLVADDEGRFEFQVGPGKYSLQGAKRGFIPYAYEQHENFWTGIVVGGGPDAEKLDTEKLVLRLPPAAIITGKIMDDRGDPVRDAAVAVFREDHSNGTSRIQPFANAATDDVGSYEVTPLPPGRYFVAATAHPWYAIHPTSAKINGGNPYVVDRTLDVAFPTSFYKDATEPDEATAVALQPGEHADVDFHMDPVPALHLFFHAPGDHAGVEATSVVSQPLLRKALFDGRADAVAGAEVQQSSPGLFEVTGIPPGRYQVQTRVGLDGVFKQPADVYVTTDGQELDAAGGEASASLKFKVALQGSAKPPPQLVVLLRNSLGEVTSRVSIVEPVEAGSANLAPGEYDVSAASATKLYSILRMTRDGKLVPGHRLTVSAGSELNVSLVLAGSTVAVDGVAKKNGKPFHSAMIVLVPSHPEGNVALFRRDQSDLDGSFLLQQVMPGTYTLVAIEDGWNLDWAKPEVLERYLQRGQKIVVGEATKGPLHLPGPVEVQAKGEPSSE